MLDTENISVRELLLAGNFGLEKEMLRITPDGHLAHTPHPFRQDEECITRDFCENQIEINTPVFKSARGVVENLRQLTERVRQGLDEGERLWPFSNPPYIRNEEDIPVAQFNGSMKDKTFYRNHLAQRYGKYMMTLSGIHFNYSFSGDLLRRNYEALTGTHIERGMEDRAYREYESHIYLDLAEKLVAYGWIMTTLTAASPLMDSSYPNAPTDCASVRCSDCGYWNTFIPVLNYRSVQGYADSIRAYVDHGDIMAPSEFYYPIRLKPKGDNTLERLRNNGINHIELRMIDLNPLKDEGIEQQDVEFAQLLLVWLAATPSIRLSREQQETAVENYKHAAAFDLTHTTIQPLTGPRCPLGQATYNILGLMKDFFRSMGMSHALSIIAFQERKVTEPEKYRYADIIKRRFSPNFVEQGRRLLA